MSDEQIPVSTEVLLAEQRSAAMQLALSIVAKADELLDARPLVRNDELGRIAVEWVASLPPYNRTLFRAAGELLADPGRLFKSSRSVADAAA